MTELVNACCLYALIPLRSDLKHRERIVLLWTPVAIGWLHFLLSMSNEAMGYYAHAPRSPVKVTNCR